MEDILNKKDVSMADAEQVKSQTGFSIGGVSPVAHLNRTKILIDSSLSSKFSIQLIIVTNCDLIISFSLLFIYVINA